MFMSGKNTEGNNLFYIEKNLRLEEKIAISFFSMRKVLEDKLSGIQWDLSKNFFSKKNFLSLLSCNTLYPFHGDVKVITHILIQNLDQRLTLSAKPVFFEAVLSRGVCHHNQIPSLLYHSSLKLCAPRSENNFCFWYFMLQILGTAGAQGQIRLFGIVHVKVGLIKLLKIKVFSNNDNFSFDIQAVIPIAI